MVIDTLCDSPLDRTGTSTVCVRLYYSWNALPQLVQYACVIVKKGGDTSNDTITVGLAPNYQSVAARVPIMCKKFVGEADAPFPAAPRNFFS